MLFRFADLSSGTARLNGRDLAGYDPDDVRAVISGCAQDPHIFDASIRDKLRLARPQASDAELARAASSARLLDWITSLPAAGTPRPETAARPCRRPAAAARVLVAERGTHAELIRSGGAYYRLWQAGYARADNQGLWS